MKSVGRYAIILLLAAAPFVPGAIAQGSVNPPQVKASLTPDSISIGDHVRLRVEVEKDMMQVVDFPSFHDQRMGDNIVIIDETLPDTVSAPGRRQTLVKEYLLTCFREGLYNIGTFPVLYADKNIVDTLHSRDTLRLLVTTFQVDTMMNTVFDIKRPEEAPLLASEVSGYLKWIFTGLCFLFAAGWLVYSYLKRREGGAKRSGGSKPKEEPHVRAIRELEALHNQKLWQNNRHKQYYTALTDIIRTFLDGRFGIKAMEMTSDEIMSAVGDIGFSDKNRTDLREMLYTADLVKFAKHLPPGDDSERIYYNAYYFVEDTKQAPEEDNEKYNTVEEPEDGN